MARIIRDTSPFIPGQGQPDRPQPDRDKTQRAAGWLGLANAVVSSPITGALIRGGQAIKHGVEDSNYKAAAQRYATRQRMGSAGAAIDAGSLDLKRGMVAEPISEIGTAEGKLPDGKPDAGFTLRDEEPESIFGMGALSGKSPRSSLGLSLAADDDGLPPRLGAGTAPDVTLPPLEDEPVAAAPARSVDDDKTVREAEQLARGAIGAVTGAKPPGPGMDAPPQPRELDSSAFDELVRESMRRKTVAGAIPRAMYEGTPGREPLPDPPPSVDWGEMAAPADKPETPDPLWGADSADLSVLRAVANRRAGVTPAPAAAPVDGAPPIVQPTRLEAARDRSAGIASGLGPLAVFGEDPDFGETPPPAAGLGDLTDKSDAVLRQALDGLGRGSATDPRIAARKYMIQTELQKREQGVADAKMSQDRYRADAPLRADEERQIAADDEVLSQGAPIEREDIWHAARGADTLEKQQKVLQDVARARVPIASFADLISNAGEDRLMQEARSLFPGVRDEESDEVKREINRLKAIEIAERTLGYAPSRRLKDAQSDLLDEKDTDLELSRPGKEKERAARAERMKAQADNYEAKTKQIGAEQDARLKLMAAQLTAYGNAAKLSAGRLKKLTATAKGGGARGGRAAKAIIAEMAAYETLRKTNANELEPLEKELADYKTEEASLESQLRKSRETSGYDEEELVGPTPPEKTNDARADASQDIAYRKEKAAWHKRITAIRNAAANEEKDVAALKVLRESRAKKQAALQKLRADMDSEIAPALRAAAEELAKLNKRALGAARPAMPGAAPPPAAPAKSGFDE